MVGETSIYDGISDNYATPLPQEVVPEYSHITPPPPTQRNRESSLSLIKELDPNKVLHEMMQQMQGKIYDDKQDQYIEIKGAKPFMNEEGMDAFFHYATAVISSLVTMSNYTKDYKVIHAIVRYHLKDAIIHFHLHWQDYGISRKTKINIISKKLFILGLSAFYKAIGAGDRKAATSNISETISTFMRGGGERQEKEAEKRGMIRRILGR